MIPRSLPAFVLLAAVPVHADTPIRIGLDTQGVEWVVSLEGGGEVQSRAGLPLMTLKDGEKLRIWWDSRARRIPRTSTGCRWALPSAPGRRTP